MSYKIDGKRENEFPHRRPSIGTGKIVITSLELHYTCPNQSEISSVNFK